MIGRLSFLLTKTLCFSVCVWFFVLGLGFPAWGELVEAVVVHSEDYKTFGVLFTNGQVNRQLLSAKEMQYTADDWVPEGSLFHIKRYSFEQQQEMPWIQQLLETLKAYAPQTQLLLADQLRLGILAEGGTQNRLCIRASDYYTLPVESLPEVNLGPVMIKQAYLPDETPVPLGIMDCNGDQAMEVSIPWTEANAAQQARIVFNQLSCGSGFPLFVELTLRTGTDLVLESVDSAGTIVETQSFASSSTSQTVSFNHANGISEIILTGAEICLEKICWECGEMATPTPRPSGSNCVTGDDYTGAAFTELPEINVPPVTIIPALMPDGNEAFLSITDCNGDGKRDFWIPWSDATALQNAVIQFSPAACPTLSSMLGYPRKVELYLPYGNNTQYQAISPSGLVVDSQIAAGTGSQIVTLSHNGGIRDIVVIGSQVCISKICWHCEPVLEPTPTPRPIGDNCITGEDYTGTELTNLEIIKILPVSIHQAVLADGSPVPLAVSDCDGDGQKDFSIPWSEASASQRATIYFDLLTCGTVTTANNLPKTVDIYLQHGYQAQFDAYNLSGALVDSVVVPSGSPQLARLSSTSGIRQIVVTGAEICITKICWHCREILEPTPTPRPIGDNCITGEDYTGTTLTNLAEIAIPPVLLKQAYLADGTAVPLAVTDCDGDGQKDFSIPWTEASASQFASIHFSPLTCDASIATAALFFPFTVEIFLQHGNQAEFQAIDPNGVVVDTASVPSGSPQVVMLTSNTRIKEIKVIGSEICITKICWYCKPIEKPTPTPRPIGDNCITGEDYTGTTLTNLAQITVPPVTIKQATGDGTAFPLSVSDCNGDGMNDFWIPWSDTTATQNAVILFNSTTCPTLTSGFGYPKTVELYLPYGNNTTFQAKNGAGVLVDTQVAAGTSPQIVTLTSASGIKEIIVIGSQVCISKICWFCDLHVRPTPTPQESNEICLEPGQFYTAPASDLSTVSVGPVTVTGAMMLTGASSTLSITDCDADKALDVWIPWSESTAAKKALITFSNAACSGGYPTQVKLFFTHGTAVAFEALDGAGNVVDGAVSASSDPSVLETFIFNSSTGIRAIRIEGAEICLKRICWTCGDSPVEPTPHEQERQCVEASQYYKTDNLSMASVAMGPVSVSQASMQRNIPVPLQVTDCDKDGKLDVGILWSESTALAHAMIEISEKACDGAFPEQVEIVLRHGTPLTLEALDANGNVVDSVSDPSSDYTISKVLTLLSTNGIKQIRVIGSELCIHKICWLCKANTQIQRWSTYE